MQNCLHRKISKREMWCNKYKTPKPNCSSCTRNDSGNYSINSPFYSLDGLTIDIIDRHGNVLMIIQHGN